MRLTGARYQLVEVARTGDRLADFGPYVASIDGGGAVAFYARTTAGDPGIFRVAPGGATELCASAAESHPAHNRRGDLAYYAGGELVAGGAATGHRAGPLGPTINQAGDVAFRGPRGGAETVALLSAGERIDVADDRGDLARFWGLACVADSGAVCLRADRVDGHQIIAVARDGALEIWASTPRLAELGRFPAIDDTDLVVFAGIAASGAPGIFASRGGEPVAVIAGGGFESYRGALARGGEIAVFYATPRGQEIGVYSGPDPAADRLIGVGDRFGGERVTDLALNPASINAAGQLAIRLSLDGGAGVIARADPR